MESAQDFTRPPLMTRSPILRWIRLARTSLVPPTTWRDTIASSGLPADVTSLVTRMVRAAGGWRSERLDVAAELVSHFRESIESGLTPAEAIESFGDTRQAARLLRRAMRRKRGLLWHGWWWTSRSFAAAIVLGVLAYLWLAARFYLASPTISVDYVSRLQAMVETGPAEAHAWPIYREAMTTLGTEAEALRVRYDEIDARRNEGAMIRPRGGDRFFSDDPKSPEWHVEEEALVHVRADLDRIHDAATKPSLGISPNTFSVEDLAFFEESVVAIGPGEPLFKIQLPHLSSLQGAARWLAADVRHAAEAGDGERVVSGIEALVRLARQVRGVFVVEQLVAHAIGSLACRTVITIITSGPIPDDAALGRLAAAVSSLDDDTLRLRFDAERLFFEDCLQRFYTDDGNGDGHLLAGSLTAFAGQGQDVSYLLAPATTALSPSRAESSRLHALTVALAERIASSDPWKWPEMVMPGDVTPEQPNGLALLAMDPIGFAMRTSLPTTAMSGLSVRMRRDTALLALALTRYHSVRHAWPDRLSDLVPSYLDAVPRDPFNGEPLRYALRGGEPYVWSVGPDRIDHDLNAQDISDSLGWRHLMMDSLRMRWRGSSSTTSRPNPFLTRDVQIWPVLGHNAGRLGVTAR